MEPPTNRIVSISDLSNLACAMRFVHLREGAFHQVADHFVEVRGLDRRIQADWPAIHFGDFADFDPCALLSAHFDLGRFGALAEVGIRPHVIAQVDRYALFPFDQLHEVVHEPAIEIVAAESVIAKHGLGCDHSREEVQDRHVERSAAQIVDQDFFVILGAVRHHGSRGLCQKLLNLQAGQFAGSFRRCHGGHLEIGRNRNDGFRYFLARLLLHLLLKHLQHFRRNFLRQPHVRSDLDTLLAAHQAFNGEDGPVDVRVQLGINAHDQFFQVGIPADGGGNPALSGEILDDHGATLHDGHG